MTAQTIADSGPVRRRQVFTGRFRVSCLESVGRDVADVASAPSLVLLHGIGSASSSWKCALGGAFPDWRVIAWDAPGYGESTEFEADAPEVSDYADALLALLDGIGVTRCHLVGHSLGALMAACFAADHPGRVATLTLASIATGHAHLAGEVRAQRLRDRLDGIQALGPRGMAEARGPRLVAPGAGEAVRRSVIEAMARVRLRGYSQAARMLSNADIALAMARLPAAMPMQVLLGDADVVTPAAQNMRVAAMRPQAPVHVLRGVGHAMYVEDPDAMNACIRAFAGTVHHHETGSVPHAHV